MSTKAAVSKRHLSSQNSLTSSPDELLSGRQEVTEEQVYPEQNTIPTTANFKAELKRRAQCIGGNELKPVRIKVGPKPPNHLRGIHNFDLRQLREVNKNIRGEELKVTKGDGHNLRSGQVTYSIQDDEDKTEYHDGEEQVTFIAGRCAEVCVCF